MGADTHKIETDRPRGGRQFPSWLKMALGLAAALVAVILVGMLIYIWIRFQLPYAVGAVIALFHDVLITLTAVYVGSTRS